MASRMREAIARHMTYSKQQIPHYYLTMRPEVSAMLDHREEWNAGRAKEETVSLNAVLIKAAALALQAHPRFNGYYQDGALHPQASINIGIAVALPDGLVAPALLDCGGCGLDEIAQRARDLAARAKQGVLRAEEYTAATFTLTNLGMLGVDSFQAIIVPPQVAILAVGQTVTTAGVQQGALITEHHMALTLSGDHRASDGAEGAQFLGEIVACLQNPERIFV